MTANSVIPVVAATLILLIPARVAAQQRVDIWTTDNGLPQNSVTGLTQTPDGYLWLTTQEGLVRFDGVRFTVFNRSNTPEITNNRVSGAFADDRGRIWMRTEEGEILFYQNGVFHTAIKAGNVASDLRSRFMGGPGGNVAFHAKQRSFRDGRGSYLHYHYQGGAFVPLLINGIAEDNYLILTDKKGGLWFASGQRLQRVHAGQTSSYDLSRFGTGEINTFAYEDRHGSLWFGYTGHDRQLLLRIKNGIVTSSDAPFASLGAAAEDSQGNLWLSFFNHGIYRMHQESVVAAQLGTGVLDPILLTDRVANIGVGYLAPDREGGIWVGTTEGLVHVTPQTLRVFSKKDGLPEENVYPIVEDRAGRIWAGIWQSSVVRYEGGRFITVLKTQLPLNPTALFEDRSGRFWIGTIGELYYLDRGRLVRFTPEAGFSAQTEVSVIAQDKDGALWFGTSLGLSRYSGGSATVFTNDHGLPDNYIIALLHGRDGTLWIGTRRGLAAMANGQITSYTTSDGLSSNYIRSLYEDADGILWIGTYDGGLTRRKDGKFSRVTMREGISSDGVFAILEDDRGWFWMSSNQGIYRVSKQELNGVADGNIASVTSIAYNKQDGLLTVEANGGRQPAGVKARDGTLWFPTAKGIAVVDPGTVMINQFAPQVLIEDVFVDRQRVAPQDLRSAMDQGRSEIVLEPHQNNLEIAYTGISFVNSAQVKFKYKLEGLDPDWNDVGTRRAAYYSYLPPGRYTFHLIAANRDGVWTTAGASVRFTVLPPFYRTAWFLAACAATVLALLWAAYRSRIRRVQHAFEMTLEGRVGERTRIARELHDTLLQSFHGLLLRFQTASYLLPERPAEAKEKLDGAIEHAAKAITEGRDAVQGLRASTVERNDLAMAIRTLGDELATLASADPPPTISVAVEGQTCDLHPIVRDEIYKIAAEALRNAFRHAHAATVEVEIRYDDEHFRLRVRDDGKGIDPAVLANQGLEGHYGLRGMTERAALIGGKLAVWSEAGAGTEVELRLPASIVYPTSRGRSWLSRPLPSKTPAH